MIKWFIQELSLAEKMLFVSLTALTAVGIGLNVITLVNIHNALH